ncbi:MAG TPA: aminotransferase class V-fold PLP-dependent enzyme [Deltaproteobacteria bacterium]|nr:aminotransferase class V-fold PLP-dependent enzyme [Deltaproteobacteria bacterium]
MTGKTYQKAIYLDHNATTPIHPGALNEMLPYLENHFGNPSSNYPLGERAKRGVEKARKEVANLLGCKEENILFTSGGTDRRGLGTNHQPG